VLQPAAKIVVARAIAESLFIESKYWEAQKNGDSMIANKVI
jgi:hypothetical protein